MSGPDATHDQARNRALDRVRCAVAAAETGARWWALAARAQREKTGPRVDHADLYGLAGEVVATLQTLEDLADTLVQQTAGYGEGRQLRDDTGADPMERLEDAGVAAMHLRADLAVARGEANTFWSAIGHIGLTHTPDPTEDPTGGPAGPGTGPDAGPDGADASMRPRDGGGS